MRACVYANVYILSTRHTPSDFAHSHAVSGSSQLDGLKITQHYSFFSLSPFLLHSLLGSHAVRVFEHNSKNRLFHVCAQNIYIYIYVFNIAREWSNVRCSNNNVLVLLGFFEGFACLACVRASLQGNERKRFCFFFFRWISILRNHDFRWSM